MANIYLGHIEKKTSKGGTVYYRGFIGNVPVVGFPSKKEPGRMNIQIDASYIKWKSEQPEEAPEAKKTEQPVDDGFPF